MTHSIAWNDFPGSSFSGVVSADEARDTIDALFEGSTDVFEIHGLPAHPKNRGSHTFDARAAHRHTIRLYRANIERSFRDRIPCGGNASVAPTLKCAVLQVLAHEIRHATQAAGQTADGQRSRWFYKGPYKKRMCEMDARRFVDDNFAKIRRLAGVVDPARPAPEELRIVDEIESIASVFENIEVVRVSDLTAELRRSGLNNARCVQWLRERLESAGVSVEN